MDNYTQLLIDYGIESLFPLEDNYNEFLHNMTNLWINRIIENSKDRLSSSSKMDISSLILTVIYVPVFVVSILGNTCALFILSRKTTAPQFTKNLYLVNLVIADLSVTLLCIPMAVLHELRRGKWNFGEFLCKTLVYVQGVTVAASVYTITALCVDRFLSLGYLQLYWRLTNTRNAIKLIVTIWLVSFSIMSPLLIMRTVVTIHVLLGHSIHYCTEMWPNVTQRRIYDILLCVLLYVIPGIIICCSHVIIAKKLWTEDKNSDRRESEMGRHVGKQVLKQRRKAAKMLLALAILFAICWLPYHIIYLYLDFLRTEHNPLLTILPFSILIAHTDSALHPLLYLYWCKNFRINLFRLLKCSNK